MKEIQLTQGKVALVDDEDYERVTGAGKWYAAKNSNGKGWYAQRVSGPKPRKTIQLHRFLLNEPIQEVDHRNGDGLDCRRRNLRIAGIVGNRQNRGKRSTNTSGFKGVFFQAGKWRARLGLGPRGSVTRLSLGMFDTREGAARAYDAAAREHHGEFAHLNFPGEISV